MMQLSLKSGEQYSSSLVIVTVSYFLKPKPWHNWQKIEWKKKFIERSDIFFFIYIIIYYFAYITFKVHHILQHIYLGLKKLFRFFGEIKTHTDVVEILKIKGGHAQTQVLFVILVCC